MPSISITVKFINFTIESKSMGTVPYSGLSVDKPTAQKIRELAKSEGFPSTSSFIRYLVEVYPTLKRIKEMFDKGILVPVTQVQTITQDHIHKQIKVTHEDQYLPPFTETHKTLINQADIKILIKNLKIVNKFNLVIMDDKGTIEEKGTVAIKPLKDYEPEIEEVYEKGIKIKIEPK